MASAPNSFDLLTKQTEVQGVTMMVAPCLSLNSFRTGRQKLAFVTAYFAQTPSMTGCADKATRFP
jgi:hypothetical protein|tara:strand:+ start:354 stop:548 length:195 start_codon:yes stop_codon:yes gene_type:complete